MKRREFITLVGCAAAAWPMTARAQQKAMQVVGLLVGGSANVQAPSVGAFLQGLKETGYVEGQNVAIEYRFADYQNERLAELAADLVQDRVNVIVAMGPATAIAAKATTTTIPIVFSTGGDAVGLGLVASLNRPGGNITGVSFLNNALGSKRLGLLREIVPTASEIGFLGDPTDPNTEPETKDMADAVNALGLRLIIVKASTASEIDSAVASLVQQRADALVVAAQAFFYSRGGQLIALTQRHALPAIYHRPELIAAGGLMSYGTDRFEAGRQAGIYVGRILKGEKPADLPVVQSIKFEFAINLKTAKALGLTVPAGLLAIADEVIE